VLLGFPHALQKNSGMAPHLGRDRFLSDPFQFVIPYSLYHPATYMLEIKSIVKQPSYLLLSHDSRDLATTKQLWYSLDPHVRFHVVVGGAVAINIGICIGIGGGINMATPRACGVTP
jgi:hypothetical protein